MPYTNPDLDHSRLDPNKYICAFGCCTCTFRIATTKKIQYSTDGVLHAKTGLARIPGNYPPNTLFIATNEGIFIGLPKIDEKSKLDISNVGSVTILTNEQKVTLSNDKTIKGRLEFRDNQPYVPKNFPLVIDGTVINSREKDVAIYFDGNEHKGNYISLGEKNLIAEGNGINIEFLSENKLVKVFGDRSILKGTPIGGFVYSSPELLQDDYLYISVGDEKTKAGKIILTNREDKNLLSLLRTNGYVRLWNDRNDVTIDGDQVWQQFYKTLPVIRQGSVSVQMIAGSDTEKIYTFDENRRIIIVNREQARRMDELRNTILQKPHTTLTGFFDETHLRDFDYSLNSIEDSIGIDFSKYKEVTGKNVEILETDLKTVPYRVRDFHLARASLVEPRVNWLVTTRSGDAYRITTYSEKEDKADSDLLTHEIGHLFQINNPELTKKFIEKGKEFGMTLAGVRFGFKNKGPEELFPSEYSKQNGDEFQAEIFRQMVHVPSWFEKPSENDIRKILGLPTESDEVIKQRQAFRDIWLKELEKYKK